MKSITFIWLFIFIPYLAFNQTVFEAEVNPDGIVFPRLTTSQRNALNPIEGQCIYNTTKNLLECWNGLFWSIGVVGPQGPQGATGPQGSQGPTGAQGPQGPTGIQGPQGIDGAVGSIGPQGPQGDTGPQGPQGPTGAQGPQGMPGPPGTAGGQSCWDLNGNNMPDLGTEDINSDGFVNILDCMGATGAAGATGAQGPQGATGPQGPSGQNGATGPQGPQGDIGATGDVGPKGATGPQGPQGPAGPSFIGFGSILANGSIAGGSSNYTCIYDQTTQQYLITFGFNYSFTEYSTQVTAEANDVYGTATNFGNRLAIKLYNSNGTPVQQNFQFTTFRY